MNNSDFLSVDRLVEFGLGMSMAQQMVKVMNEAMNNVQVPGSIQTMPQSQSNIYVALDGNAVGPLSESEVSKLISMGKVKKDTLGWLPGMTQWKPIEQIPAILKIVALTPPALPR